MSKRGIDAPLAVQMDRLKQSMQKRDKRRDQDRQQRLVSASVDDPYAQNTRGRQSTGGVNLGPGAAAQAAVLNAAALEGPTPIRCDLCQANFRNEAMLRQHEEGPAHKKALAKDKAQREREAWMENPSAAANALQAAAWLNGEGAMRKHTTARASQHSHRQAAHNRGLDAAKQAELSAKSRLSHSELIAQARRANEPVSIDGWIPPSLEAAPARGAIAEVGEEEAASEEDDDESSPDTSDRGLEAGRIQAALDLPAEDQSPGNAGLVAYSDSSGEEESESDAEKPKLESFF